MNQRDAVEELYKKFTAEFGGPNIFSKKATREKYLREAINLGYGAREQEIAVLEKTISQLKASLEEARSKSSAGPAISPREYNLELEVKYHQSRAANLMDALTKTIREYEKVIANLQSEIERDKRGT